MNRDMKLRRRGFNEEEFFNSLTVIQKAMIEMSEKYPSYNVPPGLRKRLLRAQFLDGFVLEDGLFGLEV